jgi:hypothetical protein
MENLDRLLAEHGADIQILWDYALLHHDLDGPEHAGPVEAVVVPGGYSDLPAVEAARLYLSLEERQDFRPLVVVTGFASPTAMRQWGRSEAARLANVFDEAMRAAGKPVADIFLEPDARNLGQNAIYLDRALRWRGIEAKHVLVVCKPYLERRTYATLQQGPRTCLFTMQSPPLGLEAWLRALHPEMSAKRSIDTLVGDFERVAFPNGFLVQQPVPRAAWDAFVRLKAAGFARSRAEGPGLGLPPGLVEPGTVRRTPLGSDIGATRPPQFHAGPTSGRAPGALQRISRLAGHGRPGS